MGNNGTRMNADERGFTKVKIRKAKKGDLKKIAELFRIESAKKPYFEKYTIHTAIKEISVYLHNELYVAFEGEELVGFLASLMAIDDNKRAHVKELWVKSDCHGRSIGRSLVRYIENFYQRKGVKYVALTTMKTAGAFKFYKKIGYRENKKFVSMGKKL